MSDRKSPLDSLTADNNEVLRAIRDSDAVDWRIDASMMRDLIRKTPAERLRIAEEAAASLEDLLERIHRFNP
ncbi:MAG TPA: hypothetical protein VNN08_06360 [Thermoanaerobaculia bacterium]|nr:hypothetical protein [Thermoanaerobaculia bacterium]